MSQEKKPPEGSEQEERNDPGDTLDVPITTGGESGLTGDERRRMSEALQSGAAQRLADAASVPIDARNTDAARPMEDPREAALRKRGELAQRREAREISPYDFDLYWIYRLNECDLPLTRKDLEHKKGSQAVVVTREDLETLGCIDFIHASGERMLIEPESLREGDVLILYPEDLGDGEKVGEE